MTEKRQQPWQEATAVAIGARVKKVRLRAGMGVQEVANHCTEALGYKMLRTTLANLEAGTRKNISVSELVVLAEALNVSPLELLYPITNTEPLEYLPGDHVSPWEAWGRFTYPLAELFGGGVDEVQGVDPQTLNVVSSLAMLSANGTTWEFVRRMFRDSRTPPGMREQQEREAERILDSSIPTFEALNEWGIPLDGFDNAWIDALRDHSEGRDDDA
ncbi:helix-turn-helix transcriptional regulator [Cellulosimicrobium funkei]|nr:helix-turn-helix transcriptional regulator [Cellulosimicrobium funkei]